MNNKEREGRDRCIKVLIDDAKNKGKQPDINAIENRVREMQEKTDKKNR